MNAQIPRKLSGEIQGRIPPESLGKAGKDFKSLVQKSQTFFRKKIYTNCITLAILDGLNRFIDEISRIKRYFSSLFIQTHEVNRINTVAAVKSTLLS